MPRLIGGAAIDAKLDRGFLARHDIQKLRFEAGVDAPSDLTFAADRGANNSVTEQHNRVIANWDDNTKEMTLAVSGGGDGYFIPYVGNPAGDASHSSQAGVAQMYNRSLGSYVKVDDPAIEWVATGPFSGCYASTFRTGDGKVAFAHIVTPISKDKPETADTVDNQKMHIENLVGALRDRTDCPKMSPADGFGYVFWIKLDGAWTRRLVTVLGGEVQTVGRRHVVPHQL